MTIMCFLIGFHKILSLKSRGILDFRKFCLRNPVYLNQTYCLLSSSQILYFKGRNLGTLSVKHKNLSFALCLNKLLF